MSETELLKLKSKVDRLLIVLDLLSEAEVDDEVLREVIALFSELIEDRLSVNNGEK